ncbi:tRNA (guanine-N(7)-)-methyltransferase subunit WDR4-like [Trifolium medium]|uniref:tRNA (Guanine-N(7)-)-methyltransferase subunit WDR4-like n=1 Tax=Trifolium medium TaxID=97028 RepID=A0A392PNT1_9FABA|nr:tRNA (guanine-N(7)-)-methyltransferase subunit WDR4-like [Trifolium medium]
MDEEVTTESRKETEVAPALIAVHPTGHHIAVAVGPELRIFNLLFFTR